MFGRITSIEFVGMLKLNCTEYYVVLVKYLFLFWDTTFKNYLTVIYILLTGTGLEIVDKIS